MSEVLVLVEHADGDVRKPTLELLTLARRIGEPSAVVLGAGGRGRRRDARPPRRREGLPGRQRRARRLPDRPEGRGARADRRRGAAPPRS